MKSSPGLKERKDAKLVAGLEGKVLAITRAKEEAAEFSKLVKKEGGKAIPIKTIEIFPEGRRAVMQFLRLLHEKKHDYCAFMSSQAVSVLFDLAGNEQATSALGRTVVIAIGPKTKRELERRGVRVAAMPTSFSSVGLVELLKQLSTSQGHQESKKIIIPRSAEAGDYFSKTLKESGMIVDEVFLYTVRTAKITLAWKNFFTMLIERKIDAIVFTSASNVRSFFEIAETFDNHMQINRLVQRVVSIGPLTSAELEKRKVRHCEAKNHTIEGTIQLVKELLASGYPN